MVVSPPSRVRHDGTRWRAGLSNAHTTMGRPVTGPDVAGEAHDATVGDPLDPIDVASYDAASELLRALTAPVRLALVDALADGPRCVHELVDALGITQPLVSQHLKVL